MRVILKTRSGAGGYQHFVEGDGWILPVDLYGIRQGQGRYLTDRAAARLTVGVKLDRCRRCQSAQVGYFETDAVGIRVDARTTHGRNSDAGADLAEDGFGMGVIVVQQRHLPLVGQTLGITAGYVGGQGVIAGAVKRVQGPLGWSGDAHRGHDAVEGDGELAGIGQLAVIGHHQRNDKLAFVGTGKEVLGVGFLRGGAIAEVPAKREGMAFGVG